MSGRNGKVTILECWLLWCVLFVVDTQGRSLQRIHKHHGYHRSKHFTKLEHDRWDRDNQEEPMENDQDNQEESIEYNPNDQEESIEYNPEIRKHHSKFRHLGHYERTKSVDELDPEEQMKTLRVLENREHHLRQLLSSSRRSHAIRKRHNGNVEYAMMSEKEETDIVRNLHHQAFTNPLKNKRYYEVEVKEAQNSSLCNYTVVDIPDPSPDQSRIPKKLVNVMCNHAGSRCRGVGTYCCLQTYSKLDVSYGDGTSESMKIYTGCVCSLRLYGQLRQYNPGVPIND